MTKNVVYFKSEKLEKYLHIDVGACIIIISYSYEYESFEKNDALKMQNDDR